jgi:hypothetical protein
MPIVLRNWPRLFAREGTASVRSQENPDHRGFRFHAAGAAAWAFH